MKLKVFVLVVSGLLCSCTTIPAAGGGSSPARSQQGGQKPERSHKLIAPDKNAHNAVRLRADSDVAPKAPVAPVHAVSVIANKRSVKTGGRTIDAFLITGNTRVPTAKIQSELQQYRGEHKSSTDISNAMRSVIDLYSSSGLNGAMVTRNDHIVVLNVIESDISTGMAADRDSAGRHYSGIIRAAPILPGTAQAVGVNNTDHATQQLPDRGVSEAATNVSFYVIKGNHLVSTDVIQQVLKPYAGEPLTRTKLFMAKLAIMDIYNAGGWHGVAVGIPVDLAAPVTLTVFENDINRIAETGRHHGSKLRVPANWVRLGWQKLGQSDAAHAMTIWQQGVNRMPPEQLLAYIGVYAQDSAAIRRLKHIGLAHSAIILKTHFHGKPAYYVMAACDVPEDKTERHKKLAGLRRAMAAHGRIHASSASKFQTATRFPNQVGSSGNNSMHRH